MSPQSSLFDFEADGLRDLSERTEAEREAYIAVEREGKAARQVARGTDRRPGPVGNLLERARLRPDDPTPQLKNRQETLVMRHIAGGVEESDRDVLDILVTDGGEVSPMEIADTTGWHIETVYRAIERLVNSRSGANLRGTPWIRR